MTTYITESTRSPKQQTTKYAEIDKPREETPSKKIQDALSLSSIMQSTHSTTKATIKPHRVEAISNTSNVISNVTAIAMKVSSVVSATLISWGAMLTVGGILSAFKEIDHMAVIAAQGIKISFTAKVLKAEKILQDLGTSFIGLDAFLIPIYKIASKILPIAIIVRTAMGMIRDLYTIYKLEKFKSDLKTALESTDPTTSLFPFLLKWIGVPQDDINTYSKSEIEDFLSKIIYNLDLNNLSTKVSELESFLGPKAWDFSKKYVQTLKELFIMEEKASDLQTFDDLKNKITSLAKEMFDEAKSEQNKAILSFCVNFLFFIGGVLLQSATAGADIVIHACFALGAILAIILLTPELREYIGKTLTNAHEFMIKVFDSIIEKMCQKLLVTQW